MISLNQMIKNVCLLIIGCLVINITYAQKYRANIQTIDSAGFYKILLRPNLVAKTESALTDLRLLDSKDREIPYVPPASVPLTQKRYFTEFPKIGGIVKIDSLTTIIAENKLGRPISSLWLKVKNTNVIRTMNLTGSDDLKHWFAIEEGALLNQPDLGDDGEYVMTINFPASNYHYLKITVNDKTRAPINFLKVGIYNSTALESVYVSILPAKFTQRDSGKTTIINIWLSDKYQVNKLQLTISGPKYYKRGVLIYNASGKTPEMVSEAELNSGGAKELYLMEKANHLILKIDNADNLPLHFDGIEAYQTATYVLSYLEKGEYYFTIGKPNAEQPNYDLKFFKDSLKGEVPIITHKEVNTNPEYQKPVVKTKKEYTAFIWAAIIAALIVLGLLAWKMVNEIKNKEENN